RPLLEGEIAEARRGEQRLAEAISRGTPGEAAPEALLSALRVEEARRKTLEEQLATLPHSAAAVSLDRDPVARELRTRADDVRAVVRRQGEQAREALRTLLGDRVDCTPVLVAGERGYAPAMARSVGCWRPAPGPLPLVAPYLKALRRSTAGPGRDSPLLFLAVAADSPRQSSLSINPFRRSHIFAVVGGMMVISGDVAINGRASRSS